MKHLSFSRVAILVALVVTVASCGMPLYSTDGYYEEAPARRDVYRGSVYDRAPIVYERDPYTGRYYEVDPYSVYSRPARPYYDRRSNRYHNNRGYDNRYTNGNRNNTYRNYPQVQPQQNPQSSQDAQRQREEARERMLGGKKTN